MLSHVIASSSDNFTLSLSAFDETRKGTKFLAHKNSSSLCFAKVSQNSNQDRKAIMSVNANINKKHKGIL